MAGGQDTPALPQVVGRNARQLRGSVTADELATATRRWGLNWGTGRISDLEAGRVSPTIPTLVALAAALGDVRGEPVPIADLTRSEGFIALTSELTLSSDALARFLNGEPVVVRVSEVLSGQDQLQFAFAAQRDQFDAQLDAVRAINPELANVKTGALRTVQRRSGEVEQRMAKALGVESFVIDYAAAYLWQRTVADERDARVTGDASAQKRGRVTRQLQAELRAVLQGGR